jgi:hypothetical protein
VERERKYQQNGVDEVGLQSVSKYLNRLLTRMEWKPSQKNTNINIITRKSEGEHENVDSKMALNPAGGQVS